MSEASLYPAVHEGGCHCGAVRFRVTLRSGRISECNCSMCRKKGMLHAIVPASDFTLLAGEAQLETYTFNTHVAQHRFCRTCGIHAFGVPRSKPDGYTVNVRCLDEDLSDRVEIAPFDGVHWERTMAERS